VNPDFPQRRFRRLLDGCCDAVRWLAWQALTGLVAMGCSTYGQVMTPEEWVLAVGPAPRRGDRRLAREAKEGIRQIESFLGNADPVSPPTIVRPPTSRRAAARRDPRRRESSRRAPH
jgi:hypothetical protein